MLRIKKKFFYPYLIFVLSLVVALFLVAIYSHQSPKAKEYPVAGNSNDYAGSISITNGNLNNDSFVTTSDEKTYYVTDTQGLAVKNSDSGTTTILTSENDVVRFLSSDDQYVYCLIGDINNQNLEPWHLVNKYYGGGIYRIDKKNDLLEKIVEIDDDIQVLNLFKKGNWMYYISSGAQHGLFRINIDTLKKERLLNMLNAKVNYHNEKFYYIENNEYNIACIDMLGENNNTFWENYKYRILEFQIEGDNMYCISRFDYYSLIIVVNMETFEEEILVKTRDQIDTFNVKNGVIYYTMPSQSEDVYDFTLMQFDIRNNESKVFDHDISPDNIVLIDNSVYYYKNKYFDNEDFFVELIKNNGIKKERIN